jgi:DMSO reductase anchor subunit
LAAVTAQLAVLAALVIAALIMVSRFEMLCLRDLAQTADADLQYLTRQGWMLLILLVIPLGGIMYLYRGKAR